MSDLGNQRTQPQSQKTGNQFLLPLIFIIATVIIVHFAYFRVFFKAGWAGAGDGLLYQWNFWWLKNALLGLGQSPWFCPYMFAPVGVSLAFHDLTPLYGFMAVPFLGWVSSGVIYNIFIELIVLFSALGAYFLVYELTSNRIASLIGAMIYAFNPFISGQSSQLSVVSVQWLPFALLFGLRVVRHGRVRSAIWCGLMTAASFYCSFSQTILIGLCLFLFWTYYLASSAPHSTRLRLLVHGLIVIGVFLLLAAPLVIVLVRDIHHYGFYAWTTLRQAENGSVDLASVFLPATGHPIWGNLSQQLHDFLGYQPWRTPATYVGIVPLCLALLSLFYRETRNKAWPWLVLGLVMFILSLGPTLGVLGKKPFGSISDGDAVLLPFSYLAQFPLFNLVGEPMNLLIVVYLVVSVLAALTVDHVLIRAKHTRNKWLAIFQGQKACLVLTCFVAVFIILDYLPLPHPSPFLRPETVYQKLAEQKKAGTMLFIPVVPQAEAGQTLDHALRCQIVFLQTIHQSRLLSGYVPHCPSPDKIMLPTPFFLEQLSQVQDGSPLPSPEVYTRILQELPYALALLNIDTIVFDKKYVPASTAKTMINFLHRILLFPETMVQDEVHVWEIPPAMRNPDRYTIDFEAFSTTDPIVPLEQITVIHPGSPVIMPAGRLDVSLPAVWQGSVLFELKFEPVPYATDITLSDENNWLSRCSIGPGQTAARLLADLLPTSNSRPRRMTLSFSIDDQSDPALRTDPPSPLPRILTYCAGVNAGHLAWVQIDDREFLADYTGYSLLAWDRGRFQVPEFVSFQSHSADDEADRLETWLAELPPQTVVVGNFFDEMPSDLSRRGARALTEIGCSPDTIVQFPGSYTFIGIKGLAPGKAIESYSPGTSSVSSSGVRVPLKRLTMSRNKE